MRYLFYVKLTDFFTTVYNRNTFNCYMDNHHNPVLLPQQRPSQHPVMQERSLLLFVAVMQILPTQAGWPSSRRGESGEGEEHLLEKKQDRDASGREM